MGGDLSLTGLRAHTHTAAAGDGGGALSPATLHTTGLSTFDDDSTWANDKTLKLQTAAGTALLMCSGANRIAVEDWAKTAYKQIDVGTVQCTGYVDGVDVSALPRLAVQTVQAYALGSVYQNTSGRPILIVVSGSMAANNQYVLILTDASNPPTVEVCRDGGLLNMDWIVAAVILSGNYYKVVDPGNAALDKWTEWS